MAPVVAGSVMVNVTILFSIPSKFSGVRAIYSAIPGENCGSRRSSRVSGPISGAYAWVDALLGVGRGK